MPQPVDNIIFDLGGVLIDWNPEYLYSKVFGEEKERMDWFLSNVCTPEWNMEQDAGRTLKEGTELLIEQFPGYEAWIRMFYDRWEEMIAGEVHEVVNVLESIKKRNKERLFALTNWSSETFVLAQKRFDFLSHFEGIVVSGQEGTRKPFERIYQVLLQRYSLDPLQSVFIDDNYENIRAAEHLGIRGIHFRDPEQLIRDLQGLDILNESI